MNTDNLILRTATHAPLTTKGTYLVTADFDDNNINIYDDFVSLATSSEIADYNASTTYDDTLEKYCTYNGRTYQYVNASHTMGNLPTDTDFFVEIFPTELAHQKNRDTILDEGGVNETSASEIRAFIDAGLTIPDNTDLALKVDKATFPVSETLALSDETTALTAGTAKITVRIPYAFTLTGVRASLTTAQTSGSIFTVDINQDGVSVLSTKLTIDNTEKISTTAVTPAVISTSAFTDYSEITIDIDQIGDGTAKGLKVSLIGTRSI